MVNNDDFNNFEWHDAIINTIEIDRKSPGFIDEIVFEIKWPNGIINKIIFKDVYLIKMNLNFGITAPESIFSASISEENDIDLISFYKKWSGLMDDIKLKCYIINTSSTGSEIKIISKNFSIDS